MAVRTRRSRIDVLEQSALTIATLCVIAIPATQFVGRAFFDVAIAGGTSLASHCTIWIGMIGAAAAARQDRHLGLADIAEKLPGFLRRPARPVASMTTMAVCTCLIAASARFVESSIGAPNLVGGIVPLWIMLLAFPIGFTLMALATAHRARFSWAALAGPPLAYLALEWVREAGPAATLPAMGALALAFVLGAPIFVGIGGAAILLFAADGIPIAGVALEGYRLASSPIVPAIPLFTLVGFLMTESRASERLVAVFRALFGWLPGGVAIATVMVCAFFASFTGSSGVLILALGGLLGPVLISGGYRSSFAIGLIASAGSTGLLLPPSLALILFAVVAQVSILDIFVASLAPAAIMILGLAAFAVWTGARGDRRLERFNPAVAARALWAAKWEMATPIVALGGVFGGFMTLFEAAAATVVYVLFVLVIVRREISARHALAGVIMRSSVLVGGVFAILVVSMALTGYLIDAQVPDALSAWAAEHIQSPLLFLLCLNIALLIAGCLIDVFSAIAVLTPLIMPLAERFGISPIHIGIVFLANLELGYLTPPVGMNLYLAAFRFEKPLAEVIASVLPFAAAMLGLVLALTYLPLIVPLPGF